LKIRHHAPWRISPSLLKTLLHYQPENGEFMKVTLTVLALVSSLSLFADDTLGELKADAKEVKSEVVADAEEKIEEAKEEVAEVKEELKEAKEESKEELEEKLETAKGKVKDLKAKL
jgi:F0F1-type ATP synthase membrane subunit b/b'